MKKQEKKQFAIGLIALVVIVAVIAIAVRLESSVVNPFEKLENAKVASLSISFEDEKFMTTKQEKAEAVKKLAELTVTGENDSYDKSEQEPILFELEMVGGEYVLVGVKDGYVMVNSDCYKADKKDCQSLIDFANSLID